MRTHLKDNSFMSFSVKSPRILPLYVFSLSLPHSLTPIYTSPPQPSYHSPPIHYITLFGIIFAQRYELHFCIFKLSLIHSCPFLSSVCPGGRPTHRLQGPWEHAHIGLSLPHS